VSLDLGAAREKVRVARALGSLPRLAQALAQGELSYAKVRALTRVATPESEERLLAIGRAGTAEHVERIVRGWRRMDRKAEALDAARQHAGRALHVYQDEDGTVTVRGRLAPEVGALLVKALAAAREALYQRARVEQAEAGPADVSAETPTMEQQQADALALLAETALHHGIDPGAPGERYQVVVHVDAPVLADPDQPGQSVLEDGVRVSAETSRRLTCDAAVRTMTHAAHTEYTDACDCGPRAGRGHTVAALGPALDVGRSRRTIPPALRRALEFRDKGCRFPDHSPAASGARGTRFAEGHHIIHWEDGGPTSLDNLALLCRDHHRCVHEEGFTVRMDERGEPAFATPSGFPLPSVPRYDVRGRLEVLLAANRARGVAPDFRTGRTEWPRLDDVPLDVRERVG
jgi:hypothetical protein